MKSAAPTSTNPAAPALAHTGFAVLRTPLLPLREFLDWTDGLAAAEVSAEDRTALGAALERDVETLRERLRLLAGRPEFADALFVASPDLHEATAGWLAGAPVGDVSRVMLSLVRYFARAAYRATPFGLFAGCSLVPVGAETRLAIAGREAYRRHTRLDMDYVATLVRHLSTDRAVRLAVPLRTNSSLYEAAGRLHYVETHYEARARRYSLVAADRGVELEAVLRRAEQGAYKAELTELLTAHGVSAEEADDYLTELLDAQLLVPDIEPTITGPEAAEQLAADLAFAGTSADVAATLQETVERLRCIDKQGVGAEPPVYEAATSALALLPVKVERSRLYQVDLHKPAHNACLGTAEVEEATRGVELLHRITGGTDPLEDFVARFEEHYDREEVSLLEALDEEVGIGLVGAGSAGAVLGLRRQEALRARDTVLAELRLRAAADSATSVELTPADVRRLAQGGARRLPDALGVFCTVLGGGESGEFRLLLNSASGPSGVRMLGRFAHLDEALDQAVREHIAAEERARPDAIFAEVVHLPQGRIGNIAARPIFRGYEIPYLGRSTLPPERQIPVADLTVAVANGRLVLRSERLGREVVPRLSCAHNFGSEMQLPVYRFLGMLQHHRVSGGLCWEWGQHQHVAAFLPRVTSGRLILARATWRVAASEVEGLNGKTPSERFAALQKLAAERSLPRLVVLAEFDNQIPLDLRNALCAEILLQTLKKQSAVTLLEFLIEENTLCAEGPEGRFTHELLIPLVRPVPHGTGVSVGATPVAARVPHLVPAGSEHDRPAWTRRPQRVSRTFAPGSEWVYAKLYCGQGMADQVLRTVVAPIAVQARRAQAQWFFIRYADPHFHVRVRVRTPRGEVAAAMAMIGAAAETALANGTVSRLMMDTYVREVERYGGPEGVELCEHLFHADSETALGALLAAPPAGDDLQRQLDALAGVDRWLADFELPLERRIELLARRSAPAERRHQFGQWFRRTRREVAAALEAASTPASSPLATALATRSAQSRYAAAALRRLEAEGRLTVPCDDIVFSVTHMWANRFLRVGNSHEALLYDALRRHYESVTARSRPTRRPAAEARP